MSRTSFSALLEKYLAGDASPAEREVVEQWYALLGEEPKALNPEQWESLKGRLWHKINLGDAEKDTLVVPLWQRKPVRWSAAAAIFILLTAGMLYFRQSSFDLPEQIALEKARGVELVVNTTREPMVMTLEEGSRVTLNPGAQLKYPTAFAAQTREVFLTGEAFFEISENPNRPFLVNTGKITTRVLGTSFLVKALAGNPEVEVAVKTGKVSVYESIENKKSQTLKNNSGVILTPNHKVRYLKENKLFVTGLVENPVLIPATEKVPAPDFNFDDSPLDRVIGTLEQAYSIDIEVEKKSLRDCPLTANLSNKALYAQLDLICAVIQGTYEVKGTTILISGKGCD